MRRVRRDDLHRNPKGALLLAMVVETSVALASLRSGQSITRTIWTTAARRDDVCSLSEVRDGRGRRQEGTKKILPEPANLVLPKACCRWPFELSQAAPGRSEGAPTASSLRESDPDPNRLRADQQGVTAPWARTSLHLLGIGSEMFRTAAQGGITQSPQKRPSLAPPQSLLSIRSPAAAPGKSVEGAAPMSSR
jgi:hypothetical protein